MGRTEYKNQYRAANYDRIELAVPKGEKEKIQAAAAGLGMSVNEYLFALVCEDMAAGNSKLGEKKQGFNDNQKRMLEKWQVARKYYDMIEDMSYSKEDGYYIYLKAGYINDVTGTRTIHCDNPSEVRQIINKSHKK